MPLSAEERRYLEDLGNLHVRSDDGFCHGCGEECWGDLPQDWPCNTAKLLTIIERITPTIFNVGDRVMAINYKNERLGKGRVTASQRDSGFYMKVRLDEGLREVIVPQATSKRLVRKTS